MKNFLKWWIVFVLVTLGVGSCVYHGVHERIWNEDASKISSLIGLIFMGTSLYLGKLSFQVDGIKKWNDSKLRKFRSKIETGWFVSDLMTSLGLFGTVLGFWMALGAFTDVDATSHLSIQNGIKSVGDGMSTAIITTVVGIVSSIVTKIQCNILRGSVDTVKG